jgi:hypothetical protein
MKSLKVMVLLLLLLPALAVAQKKEKKPSLPAIFDHARYVYVEAVGGEQFNPNLYPADRLAIADVRDAIKAWGRYTFTAEREKADLIFVVRKGRPASADAGGDIGEGPGPLTSPRAAQQRPQGAGLGVGGETGPADDLLEVCQLNQYGKLTGPLWIHSMPAGLDAPHLLLFKQFKEEVEKAYPGAPPNPPAKP